MILAQSSDYMIYNEYEAVYLVNNNIPQKICIAEMYGDPSGAYISDDEKYCIIFGCGVVVYMIEPLKDCMEKEREKRFDFFIDDKIWFSAVLYADTHTVILKSENNGNYTIDLDSKNIRKSQ